MKIPRFIRGKCDNIYFSLGLNENIAYSLPFIKNN